MLASVMHYDIAANEDAEYIQTAFMLKDSICDRINFCSARKTLSEDVHCRCSLQHYVCLATFVLQLQSSVLLCH
ncbi:unnamed protein product [Brugia pahangi]|uniref:Ovule protein n=1 Tax=Brugia pahangi TaxID=6280 RepID=A0A0N4TZ29_BRUPA|nr:unnamed protein product [Brugia pahangi]